MGNAGRLRAGRQALAPVTVVEAPVAGLEPHPVPASGGRASRSSPGASVRGLEVELDGRAV